LSACMTSGDMGWILSSLALILRLMTIFTESDRLVGLMECLF
jgi:hypothetical protein